MTTEHAIFKEEKGISFEILWKKYLPSHFQKKLGKWKIQQFQYLLGFNLTIADVILIGGALNRNHLSLCLMNFCVRIRWRATKFIAMPMPKPKKKVKLRTAKKRRR